MNNPNYKTIKYIDGEIEIDVYEIDNQYYLNKINTQNLLQISARTFKSNIKILKEKLTLKRIKGQNLPFYNSKKSAYYYSLTTIEEIAKNTATNRTLN